jgi:predicted membrane metal-binding protein
MRNGLVELLGVLVVVLGAGVVVAAAALVSTPLAVLAAGVFLIFGGVIAVYVAATLDKTPPAPPKPGCTWSAAPKPGERA